MVRWEGVPRPPPMVAGQRPPLNRTQSGVRGLPPMPTAGVRNLIHRVLSPCMRDPRRPPRADGRRCRACMG
eukprot:15270872-Alexandrium_andersonii.AAC.1